MTASRQTIWIGSEATAYSECCECCLGNVDANGDLIGHRAALVQGTLRRDADVGFTSCRRGHRVTVRRAAGPVLAAAV